MRVIVTGAAGFIGSNLVLRLLKDNESIEIVGIDNLNDYYDVNIKYFRLNQIAAMVQEKQQTDGSRLFQALQYSKHRPQILYGLRARRTTGLEY